MSTMSRKSEPAIVSAIQFSCKNLVISVLVLQQAALIELAVLDEQQVIAHLYTT